MTPASSSCRPTGSASSSTCGDRSKGWRNVVAPFGLFVLKDGPTMKAL